MKVAIVRQFCGACFWLCFLFFSDVNLTAGTTIIDGTVVDTGGARYYLGFGSSFNLLIITNGGTLKSGFADIGENSGDQGNQAFIVGTNSLWSSATMYLGVSGPNNTVTVAKGGTVSIGASYGIILGSFASSTGNQLKIIDGGKVFVPTLEARRGSILLSNGVLGVSSLAANANGSIFSFVNGILSTTNGLSINNGTNPFVIGRVTNGTSIWNIRGGNNAIAATNGFILGGAVGTTNFVNVSGSGATLTPTGPLYLGNNGISAGQSSITLTPGTTLQENTIVGALDGSGVITNNGGVFEFTTSRPVITNTAPGSIICGNAIISYNNVTNAPVSIQSDALTNLSFLGAKSLRLNNSTNAPAQNVVFSSFNPTNYTRLELVGGTNQWNGTNLTIGPWGSMLISNCVPLILPNTGHLTILDNSKLVYDGDRNNFNSAASNLTVVVSGTNAEWYNQRFFTLGSSGGHNLFMITNGASLVTTNNDAPSQNPYSYDFSMGYYAGSTSNTIIVTGPGSAWNNWGEVDLGVNGSGNQAAILNGAKANGGFVLGSAINTSSNNVLLVSGEGSTLTGGVTVGNSGSQNQLVVADGATAQLGGVTIGYLPGAINNSMNIIRANVTADTINIGFYGTGNLSLNRGTLTVSWLYQNAGPFNFVSGIVNVWYSQVNFIVGDGFLPARLNLTGSYHQYSILVSTNGTLTGIAGSGLGAIQSDVTSYGTIAPGNPIGEIGIAYHNLWLQPSSTLIFNVQGTNQGVSYSTLGVSQQVQFAGNLRIRLLNDFKPASGDVFNLMSFGSKSGAFVNVASGARIKTTDGLGSFLVDYSGTSLLLSNYQSNDLDGDGIDDAWALQYFGHTPLTLAEKQADADGDRQSNSAEFIAGTDPTNSANVFKITSASLGSTGVLTLQFNAVAGKTYGISFSDDLLSWNSLAAPLLAWIAPGTYQWIDDGTETGTFPKKQRFYRVTAAP